MAFDLVLELIRLMTILYVIMLAYILIRRGIRTYSRSQCLKFTQGEVKEKRKEVETLRTQLIEKKFRYEATDIIRFNEFNNEFNNAYLQIINNIFYIYNDLIIGIYEGLFDERYVKMTIGQEILMFYKKYGKFLASNEKREDKCMALEMMLKKWDTEGYIMNLSDYKHRRL